MEINMQNNFSLTNLSIFTGRSIEKLTNFIL